MHIKLITFCFLVSLTTVNFISAQQVTVSTIQLASPLSLDGLIVADDGTLYGAEGYNGSRIHKINLDGTSEVFASNLNGPIDMDFDDDGNLYVTTFNNTGVYKITPTGVVSRYASVSVGPSGIVLNRHTRDVYVSHFGFTPFSGNSVYRIDSAGIVTAFVQNAQLKSPVSLAIDDDANLYTPNIGDSKLFKITQNGNMSLLASLPTSGAMFNIGHIEYVNGKLYVTGNTGRHYLYEVDLDGSYQIIAGTGIAGSQDGEGLSAQFNGPNGIAASVTGDTLFISELNNPSRIRIVALNTTTGTEEDKDINFNYYLKQNFPNPFNPTTIIDFDLAVSSQTRLVVHNLLGQEIKVLVDGEIQNGSHRVKWNGTDNNGNYVSSGIYFYSLITRQNNITKKMMLSK